MTDRLALSIPEACEALGVGETYFRERVLPEIKVVRVGRRTLIPMTELKRFLEMNAALS